MAANASQQDGEVRAHRLWVDIADKMIRGTRDPEEVARVLQVIKDKPDFILELKLKKGGPAETKSDSAFKVAVDYTQSLKDMIQAGKYDWVNDDITAKHFPIKSKDIVAVELELVHFNRGISSDDAIAEIKQKGLRPAKIEEILAFGEKYPEEQRKFPIVALGSVYQNWSGYRLVPYLYGYVGGRDLFLSWCEDDWGGHYRFLAVRES